VPKTDAGARRAAGEVSTHAGGSRRVNRDRGCGILRRHVAAGLLFPAHNRCSSLRERIEQAGFIRWPTWRSPSRARNNCGVVPTREQSPAILGVVLGQADRCRHRHSPGAVHLQPADIQPARQLYHSSFPVKGGHRKHPRYQQLAWRPFRRCAWTSCIVERKKHVGERRSAQDVGFVHLPARLIKLLGHKDNACAQGPDRHRRGLHPGIHRVDAGYVSGPSNPPMREAPSQAQRRPRAAPFGAQRRRPAPTSAARPGRKSL